jgi:tripartite-type tricarboxylate transporter receptor subunit TctC
MTRRISTSCRLEARRAALGRLVGAAIAIAALACSGLAAWSQGAGQAPKQVKLVVPVPPGASTDFVARLMAEQVGRAQAVNVVVENRPGASGMIGTEAVSRAAPDGATLLMTANTYLIDAQTRKASYHPVDSFAPICFLVESPAVLVVNAASPYRSLADLLNAARAKPGELTMASVGPGTSFQIGFVTLTRMANVNMIYVPYAGSAPALNAVLGEHVTSVFAGYAVVAEQLRAGQLRALATATLKRIEPLPELPTFDELGFRNLEVDNWIGVIAPAKTPQGTLAELAIWFTQALQGPEVKARLATQGLYPVGTCGADFGAFIHKRYDEYGQVIRESNIKVP